MLKKMRRRFIRAAMTAFGVVLLVLVLGTNLINCYVMAARQDRMIDGIREYEELRNSGARERIPMISEMPWAMGPEADYTTRFFVVHCDLDGQVIRMSREHIASVSEENIRQYAADIFARGRFRGYYKEYRYMLEEEDEKLTIVFLNVSSEFRFIRSLAMVSVLIAAVSLFAAFLLVLLFSRRAVRPYMKNMERQRRFITDAGHELKTPLTSITTSADILAMEYERNEWVVNIQKQAARLSRLVSSLVTLSRLDEETPFPEKTVFSLSEAAWEIAEPFGKIAAAEGKTYVQQIEDGLEMTGDQNAVQQMLSILLDNAVKYSDEEGEIRLTVRRRHRKLWLEVFNTCELSGVTELDRLFDRFYRPDESRSVHTGGTGIGLSMAQAIAEAHGGKITVTGQEGKNICFQVYL